MNGEDSPQMDTDRHRWEEPIGVHQCSSLANSSLVGLVAACCWLAPAALSLLSGEATALVRFLGNASSLLFAPLFVLLAVALGDWLLGRVVRVREEFSGRWLFAAGWGFGAFSIGTLVVGMIGIPNTFVAWIALALLAVLLRERSGALLLRLHKRIDEALRSRVSAATVLVAVVGLVVCLNVLRAFVPPMEYDEMEYHLAAPAKYMRDGRVSFIADNAYASFPANVEMLFLDAMVMRGGVEEGFALGRLINVALGLLAACAAGACASAMFTKRAALPAAAILYTWPSVNHVVHVAYVELGLMFYAGLALLAAYQYAKAECKLPYLLLLGVSCGLAAGCKYTAVLFVCVPAAAWVLAAGGRRRLLDATVLVAVAAAVFSPWPIRNTVNTGNPVYPLLGRVFGPSSWTDSKEARWQKAHSPKDLTASGMWDSLRTAAAERFPPPGQLPGSAGPRNMSFLLVAFLPLVFFRR